MPILRDILGQTRPEAAKTLLVGTPKSIRQLRHTLREAEAPLDILGCVLIQPQHHAGAIGIPVLGTADQLESILATRSVNLALLSLPAAMHTAAQRIASVCSQHDITTRLMPTLDDQLAGRINTHATLDLDQLLNRPPRQLDKQSIDDLLNDRRVLITGAGGSIGSELAHIVASYNPAQLLLMERSENNLFNIHRQLQDRHPDLPTHALLHDVTQEQRTADLTAQHKPDLIFHAAAHKHVPMMEDHPRQAVENNLFGTRAIADAAHAAGVSRFVMISTDKAVNPTSVMGATKRLAELYIQSLNAKSETDFAMVRFGNVLGSACSVIPIWSQQLSDGLPITVTDPRMTRYLMTIPEAAALVIQAAALDNIGGQVLLLNMGDPIRILDLAQRFVAAHGLEPDRDVPIVFTGARPGEKLFEELAYHSEQMVPTQHEAVRIWQTATPTAEQMDHIISTFQPLRHADDAPTIHAALRQALPEMQPAQAPDQPVDIATGSPLSRTA